jgi:hypothetical protein
MNLADYLSELLGQHDAVSVPGLGYFVRERVNAYYNDKEGKFYPPHHQVKFVPQPNDEDDTFTQYVADKKNISLASSKYFAEKFITKLREDAATGKYLFADLGLFYTEQGQLKFKPNDKIPDDPAFYGYPMLNTYKLGQPLFPETPKPVFAGAPASAPAPATPQAQVETPARTIPRQPYYEEETERKRGMSVWLIVLIAVAGFALAVFGVYKFYPSAFDRVKDTFNKITHSAAAATGKAKHAAKTDTTKKADSLKDTATVITPVTTVDSTAESHFEIITNECRSRSVAETAVKMLKDRGVNARILTLGEMPGPLIKVSAGSFHTMVEAQSKMNELQNQGKIKSDSYTIEIKPRQ